MRLRFPTPLRPVTAALLLAATGCAGYRLGPTSGVSPQSRTLCVLPFQNETLEPRLSEAVQSALSHSLQQEGTFRLGRRDDADVILRGEILRYERAGIAFDPNDVRTVQDYRVLVVTKVTLAERRSGRVLFQDTVTGRTTVRLQDDQPSAERQALPLLAENLSQNITDRLVDGDW